MGEQSDTKTTPASPCVVTSKPSKVITNHDTFVEVNGVSIHSSLVLMKRSFLLVLNNACLSQRASIKTAIDGDKITKEEVIRGFMNTNTTLRGLSLGIGEHSSCLIESDESIISSTLATRLSKKINRNRPVYVANNIKLPQEELDPSGFMAKLYLRVFQFVNAHYKCQDE